MTSQIPVVDVDPRRTAVRTWLHEHPNPTPRDLADGGWVAPHWPEPWGQGADPITQLIIEDEFLRSGVKMPMNPQGLLYIGPSLLIAGNSEQMRRYLPPMLAAEEMWCRLYSEPDAGSDLTAIRTRAQRRKDIFVVNGVKLWAPLAQTAVLGGLLVRTSGKPCEASGLTYIICPMEAPGITINSVRDMVGGWRFNEIVFEEVEIPVENVVGEVDAGLVVAQSRHRFERVSTARGIVFGNGPSASDLIRFLKGNGAIKGSIARDRVTKAYIESEILRLIPIAIAGSRSLGHKTDLAERARKILLERHGQRLGLLACDLLGPLATLSPDPEDAERAAWLNAFVGLPANTIGADTTQIQLEELGSLLLKL